MLESLVFWKGMTAGSVLEWAAMGVGFAGGAYFVIRRTPENRIKRRVKEIFKRGEMFIRIGKNELYPTIDRVEFNPNGYTIVRFTVPVGLNPENIESKKWLFQQQFDSDDLEINRMVRRFELRVR
jgi:S-DNA-T family DNA segregation ATPase FtsK/SpoIIIE